MKERIDVICVGAAHVDIPLQPVSKEVFDIPSTPIDQIKMTVGGDAINEAVILSRLGKKAALMSRVGDDGPGAFVIETCHANHVDCEDIRIEAGLDTSLNIGLVTADGERTFITNRNGSLWKISIDDVNFERFPEAQIISLASIFNNPLIDGKALVQIFKAAKQNQLTICADMVSPRLGETLEDVKEALGYIDYFFPNFEEARSLTKCNSPEETAEYLYQMGVKNVVIKAGKKGCYIKNREEHAWVPAFEGVRAVDTIGAGDNFVAGFIAGILEERTFEECAILGNAAAAISVQYIGAVTGVRNRQQVEELIKNR